MSTPTSIPRFLLPQTGAIWRRLQVASSGRPSRVSIRFSSTGAKDKPIVLEKPERFNPLRTALDCPGGQTLGTMAAT